MSEPSPSPAAAALSCEPLVRTQAEIAEAEYWEYLYGPWDPLDVAGVAAFMNGFTRPWWVVGGRAIDAFTRVPREHEDVDVSVLACDVPALRAHVGDRWHVWNLANGDMRPLTDRHPDVFEPDSQLWIRAHSLAPWAIDMPLTPDRDGQWINKRIPDHVAPVDEVTWLADDGIRYLRPEIVLLFKARLQRLKDERDLACAWPSLTAEPQAWLRWAIRRTDEDHPWLERLT